MVCLLSVEINKLIISLGLTIFGFFLSAELTAHEFFKGFLYARMKYDMHSYKARMLSATKKK